MDKVSLCLFTLLALCEVSLSKRQYHYISDPKNWIEAQRYCRSIYSDLATVDNMDHMNALIQAKVFTQTESTHLVWIGLYDDVNSWRWTDTSATASLKKFRNWRSDEPSNVGSDDHCAAMADTGQWSDQPCSSLFYSVCANITGTNLTFVLINSSMSWSAARSYCTEHHTDLASVKNLEENQRTKELIPTGQQVWIGLSRETWKWSDGSSSTFRYWGDTEPNNMNESCTLANFGSSGKWENWPCGSTFAFFCHSGSYSAPVAKQVVRLRLQGSSLVDMNDPTVLGRLQELLLQKLKNQGVAGDVKLSWRKQADEKTFHKEKTGKKQPKREL